MQIKLAVCVLALATTCGIVHSADAAIVTVAPSTAPEAVKQRADLVCDGTDDQVELRASITQARREAVKVGDRGAAEVDCYVRHSVEWSAGEYHLGDTLVLPASADVVIKAEGTYLRYDAEAGDAVRIEGMVRCRYAFDTIRTSSTGVALRIEPASPMRAESSIVTFTGLVGEGQKGTGLRLAGDVRSNRIEGTDVINFDTGVYVAETSEAIETNWIWISYIRECNTCIVESGRGVRGNVWNVNVDATLPDSIGLRTAARDGKWAVIMGTYHFEGVNKAVIPDPGASYNVMEVHPPLEAVFAWEDNSGNDTNVLLTTMRPPYRARD